MIFLGCKADSDCHAHGTCNQVYGKCVCIDGYTGKTCEVSGKCVSINTFERVTLKRYCEIFYILQYLIFESIFEDHSLPLSFELSNT